MGTKGASLEGEKAAHPCGGKPELRGLSDGASEHALRERRLSEAVEMKEAGA